MQVKKNHIDQVRNPIHIIGTDAAGPENLPLFLQELILSTTQLAAPKRILDVIPKWWLESSKKNPLPELFATERPSELIIWLKKQHNQTIVLASGDPLWYGIGRYLIEALSNDRLVFHPSISSLQIAFARLGRPWQDTSWISLHGRDSSHLAKLLQERPKSLAILTDPSRGGVEEVRQYLHASGLEETYALWVFEQLGHPEERIQRLKPKDSLVLDLHPLHLVVLIAEKPSADTCKNLPLFGLEDGIFLQHDDRPGLMTKREIRIQLLADLELPEEGVIWDIGAGVGSIGLEALRLRPNLQLMAIEKRIGARELIQANAKRLFVNPSAIIESEALQCLNNLGHPKTLSRPDRVILGGGGLNRNPLLKLIIKKLSHRGIVVIPLVTLESVSELIAILRSSGCKLNISQHQPWRGVDLSSGTRLAPLNPVFILKGQVFK